MENTLTKQSNPKVKFHSYSEEFTKITAWYYIKEREIQGVVKPVNYGGTVVLQDGKLKISIYDRNQHSYSTKAFIEDVVRKEFFNYRTSSIFSSYTEVKNNMIDELRNATQDLKVDYFQKCEQASNRIFNYHVSMIETHNQKLEEIKQLIRNRNNQYDREYFKLQNQYSEVKDAYKYSIKLQQMGFESFLKEEMENAETHYEMSLIKLASRLSAKGVEGDMKITSGRVGRNFEVYIEHNKGITRAWTIVAEGPYVRAHYRYLVR